ncbi:AAA family ATPase [Bradyrhizobium sp. 200]|uniref:AAA family ATPase n=1 Tax=Bradyrhizobium sp. 200 TaxID=2782665 RepID=UPI001FFFAAF5|nr:AAA family ATPase [Bradyrhizobium sp. 200]UPJ53409.1 AAA family ATPase [Bradyrhizobium sp. 200]
MTSFSELPKAQRHLQRELAERGDACHGGWNATVLRIGEDETEEIPETLEFDDRKTKLLKKKVPATTAIVEAVFYAVVDAKTRRRWEGRRAMAVVLQVPSPSWVEPVKVFFRATFGNGWSIIARDGTNRLEDKASVGNQAVAKTLSEGRSVAGIAASTQILPATLVASADMNLRMLPPDGRVLRDAIDAFFGRKTAVEVAAGIGTGLDFHDLVAAFRPRSTPRAVVDRIARVAAKQNGTDGSVALPSIETAVEYGEARLWAIELARDIADYRAGRIKWSEVSRGLVVHGETGTGKSLFARAVAAYVGLPLFAFSIPDLFSRGEGHLGDVIQATNAMFSRLIAAAPCLAFWDEVEALPDRATLSARGRDWWLSVCDNFLIHLDSASSQREGVIFLAATNEINRVDRALMRPGRLEKAIEIRRPDLAGTINILRHHAPQIPEGEIAELGRLLEGSTGAELMLVTRDARRLARREGRELAASDIRAAALPIEVIASEKLRRICIHEAAHAVGSLAVSSGLLRGIVVNNKDGAAARTLFGEVDCDLPTLKTIERRVIVLLCGRAAEERIIGAASVGAGGDEESDLALSTRLIASLHASAGLGGSIIFTADRSDALKAVRKDRTLRRKVEKHLSKLQDRADRIVLDHRETILEIAEALSRARYLSGDAIRDIFDSHPASRRKRSSSNKERPRDCRYR